METIIIYKVQSKKNKDIKYIGLTNGPLSKIISYQKHTYKKYIEGDKYLIIKNYPVFRVYDYGDIDIFILESIKCDDYSNNRIHLDHKYKLKYGSIEV